MGLCITVSEPILTLIHTEICSLKWGKNLKYCGLVVGSEETHNWLHFMSMLCNTEGRLLHC